MPIKIAVYIQPNAKCEQICGEHDGMLKIKVSAPAQDNKANMAVIKLLSKLTAVPKSKISICSGSLSRRKIVEFDMNSLDTLSSDFGRYIV